jgi:hypothetical protein
VRDLLAYREAATEDAQVEVLERSRFRWDLLSDAARGPLVWKALARQMGAQALRMNLNTLQRHGVFDDPAMVEYVAGRIMDEDEIRRSKQFPYQYLAAYLNADAAVPNDVKAALGLAAEVACGNVPELPGPVVIGLDVSGSMSFPVTGFRGKGATSKMRCVDVAALFAAAVLRRNPDSLVLPFDDRVHKASRNFSPPLPRAGSLGHLISSVGPMRVSRGSAGLRGPCPALRHLIELPPRLVSRPSGQSGDVPRSRDLLGKARARPKSPTPSQFSNAVWAALPAPGSHARAGTSRRTGNRSTTSPTPCGP